MRVHTHIRSRTAEIVFDHPSEHAFDSVIRARDGLVEEAPDICAVSPQRPAMRWWSQRRPLGDSSRATSIRSCRRKQGLTLDIFMHEDSQQPRDPFVAEGQMAKF